MSQSLEQLLDGIIASHEHDPVDFSNCGNGGGEMRYLTVLKPTYL